MKYTIADVQQDKLIELGLDVKDAFIITYIKELCGSKKIIQKTLIDKTFYWIDYKNISVYLPVLGLNCIRAISKRFSKYEELGLITRHMHKKFNHVTGVVEGSYNFICFEEKFQELFEISKIEEDLEEMNKIAEKLGLSSVKNDDSSRDEKSSPSGTNVPLMETEPLFRSCDRNDGSSHNTTNNYTPIKNTTTKLEKNVELKISSSHNFSFLEKDDYSKLNPVTKSNIIKALPQLDEKEFNRCYNLTTLEVNSGIAEDFNAVLYQGLLGIWIYKAGTMKKENSSNKLVEKVLTDYEKLVEKYKEDILHKIDSNPNLGEGWKNGFRFEILKFQSVEEVNQLLEKYKIAI